LLFAVCGLNRTSAQNTTQATAVPLILPAGLVFDAAGDLIFAEMGNHLIRMVSPAGVLTTLAGTGVQGFSGDGGLASAARFDSPQAVALDSAGNLYIADTHNHRIRRVDAITGLIATVAGTGTAGTSPNGTRAGAAQIDLPVALAFDTLDNLYFADARSHLVLELVQASGTLITVAGDGTQGFAGDGGAATSAEIDSPYGLAVDAAGDLFLADTHNHRVRRVDAHTRIITTVAGTGVAGFTGEAGAASGARIDLPRGLVADAAGDLFLVDSANQRIRRIDAGTGAITTIAGTGMQGFAGDGGLATAARLNLPSAIVLTQPAGGQSGTPVFADTGNGRIRLIDQNALIYTEAGLGGGGATTLTLAAPTVVLYGSGTVSAALTASPATGSVTLFNQTAGSLQTLETVMLSANQASFSTATFPAATYRLEATYTGDAQHPAAQSNVLGVSVAPVAVLATPAAVSMLYGQSVPALTGTLSGVLPRDSGSVALALATTASSTADPGNYAILAGLTGPASGNYTLSQNPAFVTVAQAPASVTLSQSLTAHVASSTTGVPGGVVMLIDGGTPVASLLLSASGDVVFSAVPLSSGSHTLTAGYGGNTDFLPATSAPVIVTAGPAAAVDFSLAPAGSSSIAVARGGSAAIPFAETPLGGALPGAIQLSVAGLPVGATASFNPNFLAPSSSPASFVLTIQTTQAALFRPARTQPAPLWWAMLLPLGLLLRSLRGARSMAALLLAAVAAAVLLGAIGCGPRTIGYAAAGGTPAVAYNLTVTGTATSPAGQVLVHTASVVLTMQ
jgi:sugar lactone lactonase YvrE